jgi:membrane fusion protein (multidrug efflux system)
VKAKFPDTAGALLTEGSTATVEDEAFGGEPVTGTISMVSRTTDPVTRTLEVWVRIDDPTAKVRAGDSARVTAPTRTAPDALVLPTEAVQLDASDGDSGVVMVVDGKGVAHETRVKVGIRAGGKLQILEGLRGGEQVVTEGNYGLPDGTKVTVERAAAEEGSAADDQPAAKTAP